MNKNNISGIGRRFNDREITWAGLCPWTEELCYGTDDGSLYILPKGGDISREAILCLESSTPKEPINSIAFSNDYIGFSTRNDILIGRIIKEGGLNLASPFYDGGAHQIISMPSGGFIAALGDLGLLFIQIRNGKLRAHGTKSSDINPNIYKLVALGSSDEGDIFAAAARDFGLLMITAKDEPIRPAILGHHFPGIDVVDVCSLKCTDAPFATAALNIDGTLFLLKNLLDQEEPVVLKFAQLFKGTAYSVLSAQGHVIVLTDRCLVIIPNLARDFLANKPLSEDILIIVTLIQASEIFLADETTLLALVDGKSIAYEVADLVKGFVNPLVEPPDGDLRELPSPTALESTLFRPIVVPHSDWQTTTLHPSPTAA